MIYLHSAEPLRPLEIKLPAELLYNTTDCTNSDGVSNVVSRFQAAVEAVLDTGVCATNPGDCIVDEVNGRCRDANEVGFLRSRRHMTQSSANHRRSLANDRYTSSDSYRRSARSRRRRTVNYILPVLFHFGTRVPETTGHWPDEYHNALRRLYGMFDTFESQLIEGSFSITHKVRDFHVEELRNSLAYHTEIAICDIGYQFETLIKLCGKWHWCYI